MTTNKKIICFCKHHTGYLGFRKLADLGADIRLIIVQEGFEEQEWYRKIKHICHEKKIEMLQVRKLSKQPEVWKKIQDISPDFAFTIMFTQIIPAEVIEACNNKIINFHPSILPAYRGPHPVNWAIVNGETKSGVTAHFVTEMVDGGPIILQDEFEITDDDNNLTLQKKIDSIVEIQAGKCYELIVGGNFAAAEQNHSKSSYFRMRTPEDGRILWKEYNSRQIFNLVRALQYPLTGAFCCLKEQVMEFRNCRVTSQPSNDHSPGTITGLDEREIFIASKDYIVALSKVESDNILLTELNKTFNIGMHLE